MRLSVSEKVSETLGGCWRWQRGIEPTAPPTLRSQRAEQWKTGPKTTGLGQSFILLRWGVAVAAFSSAFAYFSLITPLSSFWYQTSLPPSHATLVTRSSRPWSFAVVVWFLLSRCKDSAVLSCYHYLYPRLLHSFWRLIAFPSYSGCNLGCIGSDTTTHIGTSKGYMTIVLEARWRILSFCRPRQQKQGCILFLAVRRSQSELTEGRS